MRTWKCAIWLLASMPAALLAEARIYNVDVHKSVNGWTQPWEEVSQTFICTVDSVLSYVDFFAGSKPTHSGTGYDYVVQVRDSATNELICQGNASTDTACGWVRTRDLAPSPGVELRKGQVCMLRISHSNGDPLNFYYVPHGYAYGQASAPGVPAVQV